MGELNFMMRKVIECTKKNNGFTIIELLVSLFISGILIGISFVIISNANMISKKVKVSSAIQVSTCKKISIV